MSRKNRQSKRPKRKRSRPSPSRLTLADSVPADDAPGMIDPETLIANGLPPEMVEMFMDAQQAARRGDLAPITEAMGVLEELAEMSAEPGPHSATACYPLSSPEAAEMLFAFSSEKGMDAGYASAAKTAVECDPNAVEALATLGDFAKSAEERIGWYRRACAAAESKPRDVVARIMPAMRFHMGGRLVDDARYADAIEIMLPGLDEDPDDPHGLRFALIDLMLRLGWHDELQSILNRYADDEIGPAMFARAIACFQSDGPSRHADALLHAAHDEKPYVAPLLSAIEPMPSQPARHYSAGSREEAIMIAGYLLPGVRVKDGTARWIRDTLNLAGPADPRSSNRDVERIDDDVMIDIEPGAGDLDIALSLPDGEETWQYHLHRTSEGVYIGLLMEDARLVSLARFSERPKTGQLRGFLLDSVCDPVVGPPRKPRLLHVPTKADVTALQKAVGTYGVTCEQRRLSAAEKAGFKQVFEAISWDLEADSMEGTASSGELDLAGLPSVDETWLMGVFQPPMWVGDRSTPYRPFLQLIVDEANGTILASETSIERPSPERQIQVLAHASQRPLVGQPRRPAVLIVDPDTDVDPSRWEDLSIEVLRGDDELRSCFDELITDLLKGVSPVDQAVSQQPGFTSDLMVRFYRSAARYYKAAPWMMVGGDKLIKVVREGGKETWGVTVIGQLGQTIGLSVMEDVNAAHRFIEQDGDMEELTVITVQFDEIFEMPPMDLWYLERNDWPVAGEGAYPLVMKIVHGQPICPSVDEIGMIESLMSAIPQFLDQPREKSVVVKDFVGNDYTMSWEIR